MRKNTLTGVELVVIGQGSMLKALKGVTACSECDKSASVRFESVLGRALGNSGHMEYFLSCPAECPRCASSIIENTLVRVGGLPAYFEPSAEETDVVFIDEPTLLDAQNFISGCEHCAPERAEIGFDQILDSITACDPTVTEYVICHPAQCPRCHHKVMDKTLVLAE
jgi:hypothetical protein